jgi:hypothetical protein
MRKHFFGVLSTAVIVGSTMLSSANAAASSAFNDLQDSRYSSYILDLNDRHIISGVGNGKFDPTGTLTRAQFATMMVKALSLQPSNNPVKFADAKEHWAATYIQTAYEAGLIAGTSDTTFTPDAPVKREEAAVMVWNYLKKHWSFPDNEPITEISGTDPWAKEAVENIIRQHLSGPEVQRDASGAYSYMSQKTMTRQEAAALIDLFLSLYSELPKQQTPPTGNSNDLTSIVVNQTSNTNNLIDNPDGTKALGNIKMTNSIANGQTGDQYKAHLGLFAKASIKFDGNNVTVSVPDSGDSSLWWVIQAPHNNWEGQGGKTITFTNPPFVEIKLFDHENAHLYADAVLTYTNGQWSVQYPKR